ncbi:TerD family protein [Peptoanaerobacter stomatis]
MQNEIISLKNDEKLLVGLSWENFSNGEEIDFDLLAIMLDKNEKFLNKADLIFYNNLFSRTGALFHTGDNKTGNSEADDEAILVNLASIPSSIRHIKFAILNQSQKKNCGKVSFRIAKISDIFDTKGENIYSYSFDDSDFYLMYIFEIEKNEKNFIINIKLKNIDDPIEKILESYSIKSEQFKV